MDEGGTSSSELYLPVGNKPKSISKKTETANVDNFEVGKGLEGKIIDGFKVLELKGVGGFSEVYKVQDNIGQIFALKIVKDKKYTPLLEEETKILSNLKHTQIPSVVRFGEHVGKKFLVMSYVPETLQSRLENKGVYDFEVALDVTKKILSALDYTHSKGIVHKDLKPKNVGFDENNQLIVYDFNIAKHLVEDAQAKPDLCSVIDSEFVNVGGIQKSVLGGTEGYSSPEQRKIKVDGKVHPVDRRSDIYTVGVILYEMLVGNLPQGNYEKPSKKGRMPKWLDMIVDKSLSPNPENRYDDASEMLKDINRGSEGKLDVENKAVKYFKETVWPGTKNVVFYPFSKTKGVYDSVTKFFHNDGGNVMGVLGIVGILGVIIGLPIAGEKSSGDSKLRSSYSSSTPRGTIVYEHGERIRFFSAKDALKENIPCTEIAPSASEVQFIVYGENEQIYFAGQDGKKLTWASNYVGDSTCIFSTNLANGKGKKIFDLENFISEEIKKLEKEEIENPLDAVIEKYYFSKSQSWRSIEDLRFVSNGTEKRLMFLMITGNGGDPFWYSVDLEGKNFRQEVLVQSPLGMQNVSPDGKYAIVDDMDYNLNIEWNGSDWGEIETLPGNKPIWIDYEIDAEEKK